MEKSDYSTLWFKGNECSMRKDFNGAIEYFRNSMYLLCEKRGGKYAVHRAKLHYNIALAFEEVKLLNKLCGC